MNGKRSLYTMGVSAALPQWTDTTPRLVNPPGQHLPRVGRHAAPFIRKSSSDDFLAPKVKPLPQGSSFVRDEAELERRLRTCREFVTELETSEHPWAHIELEQAQKLTFQRGASPMWWLEETGYVIEDKESLAPAMRALGDELSPDPVPDTVTYKQGTNHSYPEYGTSVSSYLLHAFCSAAAGRGTDMADKLRSALLRAADALGEVDTPLSAALYNRAKPLRKPVTAYSPAAEGAVADATMLGLCPGRRPVNGVPTAYNMAQARDADAIASTMAKSPWRKHFGADDVAIKLRALWKPGMDVYSDDITAFDKNVSRRHQLELDKYMYSRITSEGVLLLKDAVRLLPKLSPPLSLDQAAFAYDAWGTTASGDKTTANDGTGINESRVVTCMAAACKWTIEHALLTRGSVWGYLVQGDDTALVVPRREFRPEVYVATSAALGYVSKLVKGCVFLMHLHDPSSGRWAPLASRVLQQTWFNEYGGRSVTLEMFSFIARTPLQFWHNNPWSRWVAHATSDWQGFRAWGVTPSTAAQLLRRPDFIAQVEKDAAADPRFASRFRQAASGLDRADHAAVATVVANLLALQPPEPTLPAITPDQAMTAALHMAEFLALRRYDRPKTPMGFPDLGSAAANSYAESIIRPNTHEGDTDDEE